MNIFYAKMSYIKKKKLFSYLYSDRKNKLVTTNKGGFYEIDMEQPPRLDAQ